MADIGCGLNIESLQDTSTYASKDKTLGGSVTFGIGFSASYSGNATLPASPSKAASRLTMVASTSAWAATLARGRMRPG
nr:hypothetical protein [Xanthomonas cannabis]